MARLAKGINDAKKYRQKLRRLKNSREESELLSRLLHPSRRRFPHPSREMIKGPTSHSISRSSMCTPDLPCYPSPDVRASVPLSTFSYPPPYLVLRSFSSVPLTLPFSLSLSLSLSFTYTHHRHTHYFSPSPSASSSFFLPRVFCQEPSRAEASRTALKQKRSDVKCDYESCESSSRTRMLR